MQNQELCILLDSILALLETNNEDKAKEIIRNAIKRIDKGSTSSSKDEQFEERLEKTGKLTYAKIQFSSLFLRLCIVTGFGNVAQVYNDCLIIFVQQRAS